MTSPRGYQYNYSQINPGMYSPVGRERKAATILAVLTEALGREQLGGSSLVSVGCSTGIIDAYLAPHVGVVIGTDIDDAAIDYANATHTAPNISFRVEDAMALSFPDNSFDIALCSQVYEHVPDADQMMAELYRVLRPGGVCYFAATNRWSVMENHYKLPFLSWLPQSTANAYLRLTGKGRVYYEKHMGHFGLKRLVSRFRMEDVTPRLLADPQKYGTGYMFGNSLVRTLARGWHLALRPLFPGFIWLLWKP